MNTILKYKLILLLPAIIFAFAACNEEKQDPFAGKDNYITAFSLQQGEAVLHAAIAGEEITITAPEGFSLTQAKATVKLSENATIYPDPAGITGWDEEQLFAVTAYNGAKKKYKYTVQRSGIAYSGTVALETQADVDAFGQLGITHLDGNLTIGRATGTDSITSLAPLAGLKEIAYILAINPTCAITGLEGLENLEHAGTLQIGAAPHLETVALPALKSAGAITLQNTVTFIIELPALAGVSKQFTVSCPVYQLQLPNLQYTGGTFTVSGSNSSITQISLPALEQVGGSITLSSLANVTKINLPRLKKIASLSCLSMSKLSFIYAPLLEEVTGRVYLQGLAALPEFELPELTQAGEIYIESCTILRVLDFPKLTRANNIYFYAAPVNGLAGFTALQSAGSVTLYNLKDLDKVELSATVQRIDYFYVNMSSGNPAPSEINVKGVNIARLDLRGNATGTGKLVGDEKFSGTTLLINMTGASPYPSKTPQLEGFSEVDSLYLSPMSAPEIHVNGIRKVRRGIYSMTGNAGYPRVFSFSDLEEVGGDFRISYPYMIYSPATFTAITFDKLKSVGGNFNLEVKTATVDTLHFPELATVGGSFTLHTGHTYPSMPYTGFTILKFPKLTTVGKRLTVQSTSSYDYNRQLKNLDGFAALTQVGSIQITGQKALTSYEGLKKLFETLPAEGWITPTNNEYNPTYQNLKDGKWTK